MQVSPGMSYHTGKGGGLGQTTQTITITAAAAAMSTTKTPENAADDGVGDDACPTR